jgi:catechol 2,3-dioxygenase-like lactoylglutathione lyase family enzyme
VIRIKIFRGPALRLSLPEDSRSFEMSTVWQEKRGGIVLHYLTIGSNDITRAGRFYDQVLGALGIHRATTLDHEIGYAAAGGGEGGLRLWVVSPFDGKPATVGNGSMLAFVAPDRASVDAFHRLALAHDGSDEGPPGLRPYGDNFYACYVRDPDGNKLSAVCRRPD